MNRIIAFVLGVVLLLSGEPAVAGTHHMINLERGDAATITCPVGIRLVAITDDYTTAVLVCPTAALREGA